MFSIFSDPPHQPTVTGMPERSTLNVSDTLSLTCTAAKTGGAPTYFEWYKGNTKIEDVGYMGTTLKLEAVNMTSAGVYSCKACNCHGESSASVSELLIVKGK